MSVMSLFVILSHFCLPLVLAMRLSVTSHNTVARSSNQAPSWFLTQGEISASRYGETRNDLADWSAGNTIEPLMNGEQFMPRLYDIIERTQAGDSVHGTGWQLDGGVMLKPDANEREESAKTTLLATLSRAIERGVNVRLLISSNLYQFSHASILCGNLQKIPQCQTSICCGVDNRHGHIFVGTNHEKMWTIGLRQEGRLVAFTGSMDVTRSRWDTWEHNVDAPEWQMQPKDPMLSFAWHGQMFHMEGLAAEDIERTFWQRWTDDVPPIPYTSVLPGYDLWVPSEVPNFAGYKGSENAQVLRTFSCEGGQNEDSTDFMPALYSSFAPHGEYTYASIWYKALRRAKRYIFVADQFMFFREALEAVAEAAQHVDCVVVLTNRAVINLGQGAPAEWGAGEFESFVHYYQYEALFAPLAKLDPSGELRKKVHMFSLNKAGQPAEKYATQIYDHEKTLIIDDEFALVGSTGVEETGFTNDAELSFAVARADNVEVDAADTFAGKLRRRIWAEFLMLKEDDDKLRDPNTALKEWQRQAALDNMRVRSYVPERGSWHPNYPAMYAFTEPDGRCGDAAHKFQWQAVRATGSEDWASVASRISLEKMSQKSN